MSRPAPRRAALRLAAAVALAAVAPAATAAAQSSADLNAEARVYFDRGNRQLERAMAARGEQRTRLLEEALESYVDSLRVVRSRNAVFNAALALEELDRPTEAFAYYTEYLGMVGLSDAERAEAERRRGALRPRVAVVAVASEPPGARVHVDRLDLAPRGRTPVEMALPPGEHTLLLSHPHHERARVEVVAQTGERREVHVELTPEPVRLRVEAPADVDGRLLLDGEPVAPGTETPVPPGTHEVRLELPDRPAVVERVDVPVGAEPTTVRLEAPPAPTRPTPPAVEADVPGDKPLGRAPAWLGAATGALGAATVGLMVVAKRRHDDFSAFRRDACPGDPPACRTPDDLSRLRALDRDVHRANVATDVLLWTTVGLGLSTLVTALMNRAPEQAPSTGGVSIAPAPGGAVLGLEMPLGGRP
ncbi:MAG: PEGA domain-containing protein [Myxococcota bacterium]